MTHFVQYVCDDHLHKYKVHVVVCACDYHVMFTPCIGKRAVVNINTGRCKQGS